MNNDAFLDNIPGLVYFPKYLGCCSHNTFDVLVCVSQVSAHGPGLEKHGVTVNKWAEFTVDTRRAGRANLEVQCAQCGFLRCRLSRS